MSECELLKQMKKLFLKKSNQSSYPSPKPRRQFQPISFSFLPTLTEARCPSNIILHGSFLHSPSRIQHQENNTHLLLPQAGRLWPALWGQFFLSLGLLRPDFSGLITSYYWLLPARISRFLSFRSRPSFSFQLPGQLHHLTEPLMS